VLSLPETHAAPLLFTHPDSFATIQQHASSPHRKAEHRIPLEALLFRVVDIPLSTGTGAGEEEDVDVMRLYVVAHPQGPSAPGALGVWQNYGTGISSRLAEALIPAVEKGEVKVVDWRADGTAEGSVLEEASVLQDGGSKRLPLKEAHRGLRERIAGLVGGDGKTVVGEGDVFLYPTGMAAIYRLHKAMVQVRGPATVVVLGSVFHSTYHLYEEREGGMKQFGRCDAESGVMEALESWLEGEKAAARKVGYIFVEFPSNPILVSVDLRRLREVVSYLLSLSIFSPPFLLLFLFFSFSFLAFR
jgi:hypothetical protein